MFLWALLFQAALLSFLFPLHATAFVSGETYGTKNGFLGARHLRGNPFGVPGVNETYDYVIVGGGTAGNALAARLVEDPRGFSVAVVEAGSFYDNGNLTEVPGYNGWSTHIDNTRPSLVEWDIETTPQPGYNDRTIHYSQGRTLGGTSAINSLGYHRGTPGYHQMWSEALGSQDWSWENTLPYYKRSCKFTPPNLDKIGHEFDIPYDIDAFSSNGGPLEVSYGDYRGAYVNPVAKGFERIGLKKLNGLNSGNLIGYGAITLTIDPETLTRSSSETSFLQSVLGKSGLKIYHSTLAKKIVFDDEKRATGVLVAAKGQVDYEFVLSAKKEVIVSAGVFRSPQLLMVSGIGPKETLQRFGVPILSQLEGVGQNLWDQPYYRLTYKVNVTTLTQMENPDYYSEAADSYIYHRSGPLTTNNAGEFIGWEKLPKPYRSNLSPSTLRHLSNFPPDFPELELLPFGLGFHPSSVSSSIDNNWMTFAVGVLTPKSRGNVTITSPDTNDPPLVSPNFLEAPEDEEVAVQGVWRVREWAEATGIVIKEEDPGRNVDKDEEIRSWLREAGPLVFHGTSTCAMGKRHDPRAVLDSEARVYGVEGLRVVDSSSAPLLGPGHPMGTVYMIAEKIADSILHGSARASSKPAYAYEAPQVHEEL